MRFVPKWMFILFALAIACGVQRPLAYKQPPVGSYTTKESQVRLGGAVTPVQEATVTLDFFRGAGIQPFLGRFFIDSEYTSSSQRVVVLSHDFWAERFGSSPTIIGQVIDLGGRPATIIGIAPRGFKFPEGVQLWTPKSSAQ